MEYFRRNIVAILLLFAFLACVCLAVVSEGGRYITTLGIIASLGTGIPCALAFVFSPKFRKIYRDKDWIHEGHPSGFPYLLIPRKTHLMGGKGTFNVRLHTDEKYPVCKEENGDIHILRNNHHQRPYEDLVVTVFRDNRISLPEP